MRCALLSICAGIASATFVVAVSAVLVLALYASAGLFLVSVFFMLLKAGASLYRPVLCLCFYFLGVAWHLHWAEQRIDERLPQALEGETLLVEGVVTGLPERSLLAQQFYFWVLHAPSGFSPRKVALSYYGDAPIIPGQHWRFAVRLNRPHGFSNPGGFDYEAWLMRQGISARGYVRNSPENHLLADGFSLAASAAIDTGSHALAKFGALASVRLHRTRYSIRERLQELLDDSQFGGLLIALLLGDRSAISQESWALFSATGSNHLFVISGLHIGMISGSAYWLALAAIKMLGIAALLPAHKFAAAVALVAAFVYALLAGFSLPTQRAFIMIAALICGLFWNTRYQTSFRLLFAAATVLVLCPLAVGSSGFWLSFIAVGALLAFAASMRSAPGPQQLEVSARHRLSSFAGVLVRPQLVVFLALSVPLVFFTQQLSLLAPVVNIVAIPLVGFVILPFCFAALTASLVSASAASLLLVLAHKVIAMLLAAMQLLAGWGADTLQLEISQPNNFDLVAMFFAVLLLLLPRGVCRRALALPLLLCVVPMPQWLRSPDEDGAILRLHVADVGQGLAVIVRTTNHSLLYDTGARLGADFDLGSAVVTPALRALDIRTLDAVVISHGDNDHVGGLGAIEAAFPIGSLLANRVDLDASTSVELCAEKDAWNWDGVEFRFLTGELDYAEENNSSCVLQIRSRAGSILLPGDIEREAEAELAKIYGGELASTVLLAPHHGSGSSSSYAFLKRVEPDFVLVSAGYRNSFGHPHQQVLTRYGEFDIRTLTTAGSGMISVAFRAASALGVEEEEETPQGGKLELGEYRRQKIRYWH